MASLYLDSNAARSASFEECANAFLEAGLLTSPSEVHGAVCGLLCGGYAGAASDALPDLEKALDVAVTGPAAPQLEILYADAAQQLAGGDLDFQPLLPDESLELTQRVAALATWCRGFLSGYAQSRVSASSADKPVAADSAEALRDFAAIAQAAADDGEENADGDYDDLVAYVGTAALNVMADSVVSLREALPESDPGRKH